MIFCTKAPVRPYRRGLRRLARRRGRPVLPGAVDDRSSVVRSRHFRATDRWIPCEVCSRQIHLGRRAGPRARELRRRPNHELKKEHGRDGEEEAAMDRPAGSSPVLHLSSEEHLSLQRRRKEKATSCSCSICPRAVEERRNGWWRG
jgi:hypothetical protein